MATKTGRVQHGQFKDYHSVTIHGWMMTRLGLTGNKLLIYATVFQYSSMGDSEFSGGEDTLSALTNISVDSVNNILKQLSSERLILVNELEFKGRKHRTYRANLRKVYACLNTKKFDEE